MHTLDAPRAFFVSFSVHNGYRVFTVERYNPFIPAAAIVMARVYERHIAPTFHGADPEDMPPLPAADLAGEPIELQRAFCALVDTITQGMHRSVRRPFVNSALRDLCLARQAPVQLTGAACGTNCTTSIDDG
jgi:hypothetical protein